MYYDNMKVFLSWSGERSRQVAELLDNWLQCVIQASDPWMSSKDIDRGALWFTEISNQLAGTGIGVVCLTKENKNKPWILFESGALAKGISSSRVCTFLIDLKPTDVENPLAQFNHTKPNRTGLWELVRTINIALNDNSLKENILEEVFNTYYVEFDKKFKEIIKTTPDSEEEVQRSENEVLLEVLSTVRSFERRMRSIENRDKFIFNKDMTRRDKAELDVAKLMINELLSNDISPEMVIDIMDDRDVPRSFVRAEIDKYLDKNDKT